jgi:hypothetical protein
VNARRARRFPPLSTRLFNIAVLCVACRKAEALSTLWMLLLAGFMIVATIAAIIQERKRQAPRGTRFLAEKL